MSTENTGRGELIQAIAKAMGEVGKLAKDSKNAHQKYSFTSIDDFLAATNRICSANDLVVLCDEKSITKSDDKRWMEFTFSFVVLHKSGESIGPFARSVAVMFNGAQTYGSAQSYALKQFMRSLFQIACGDNDDPDHDASHHGEVPVSQTNQVLGSPSKPITTAQINAIDKLALEIFATESQYLEWIRLTCSKELRQLSSAAGTKIMKFLAENGDPNKWEERFRAAYEEATETPD